MWIWEKITGLSVFERWGTRVYIKGIVLVFAAFSAYWVYRIGQLCGLDRNKAKWSVLLFLSSGLFFYSEVVTGGYDIISVSFTLAGVYGYLKKNEKCFLLSFAAAIATKLFALWIFIPLLLLREKRIWRILFQGMAALSFVVIPKIFFAVFGVTSEGTAKSNSLIAHSNLVDDFLFPAEGTRSALLKLDGLPLIFVGMFLLWIFCYFRKKEFENRQIIFLCAAVMSIFLLTATVHPYWIILLLPYVALLISFHMEFFSRNVLLELLMTVGYLGRMYVLYPWCGSLNLIYYMLQPAELVSYTWPVKGPLVLQNLGLGSVISGIASIIGISKDHLGSMFGALFVAALLFFLYWNLPGKRIKKTEEAGDSDGTGTIVCQPVRTLYYFRLLVSVLIGLLPFLGYLLWKVFS